MHRSHRSALVAVLALVALWPGSAARAQVASVWGDPLEDYHLGPVAIGDEAALGEYNSDGGHLGVFVFRDLPALAIVEGFDPEANAMLHRDRTDLYTQLGRKGRCVLARFGTPIKVERIETIQAPGRSPRPAIVATLEGGPHMGDLVYVADRDVLRRRSKAQILDEHRAPHVRGALARPFDQIPIGQLVLLAQLDRKAPEPVPPHTLGGNFLVLSTPCPAFDGPKSFRAYFRGATVPGHKHPRSDHSIAAMTRARVLRAVPAADDGPGGAIVALVDGPDAGRELLVPDFCVIKMTRTHLIQFNGPQMVVPDYSPSTDRVPRHSLHHAKDASPHEPAKPLTAEALLTMARVDRAAGNRAAAVGYLRDLLATHPDAPQAKEAAAMLKELETP